MAREQYLDLWWDGSELMGTREDGSATTLGTVATTSDSGPWYFWPYATARQRWSDRGSVSDPVESAELAKAFAADLFSDQLAL